MTSTFYVAIGGSAGSLSQFKTFFEQTPHDSIAYIILQHLPVECQSSINTILRRHSKLDIIECSHGLQARADNVYFAPKGAYISIDARGKFIVHPRRDSANWALNVFFDSLAKHFHRKVIAIVLSGAGSDGTAGASRIKHAGGKVLVQEPATCEFPYMPLNVIQSGCYDESLPTRKMPDFIKAYVNDNRKG